MIMILVSNMQSPNFINAPNNYPMTYEKQSKDLPKIGGFGLIPSPILIA